MFYFHMATVAAHLHAFSDCTNSIQHKSYHSNLWQPLGTEVCQNKASLAELCGDSYLYILEPCRETQRGFLPAWDPDQPETPFLSLLLVGESIATAGASMGGGRAPKSSGKIELGEDCAEAKGLLKGDFPQVHVCWLHLLFLTQRGLEPHHRCCISEQGTLVLPRICQ